MRKLFALTLALAFALLAASPALAVDVAADATPDVELDTFLAELGEADEAVLVNGGDSCRLSPSQVDEECYCLSVYEPVCGCDGQTYTNSCLASCVIKRWTPGECA